MSVNNLNSPQSQQAYIEQINHLRKEKNVVILAHYYQVPEIQDIADYTGDSLALAQRAAETDADIILFAGVHFMAETAKALNPEKKVLLPDLEAGCSLADSCPTDKFKQFIAEYPDHTVITYINSTSEIKAMTDVICTSGNAVEIVNSFPVNEKIIFAPDKNLGAYVNQMTGRNMVLWDGSCEVHDVLSAETMVKLKLENPDAELIAHPECKAVVLEMADFVGSTARLLKHTQESNAGKFIVATETGILHQMQKNSPDKEFIIVPTNESCSCNDCPFMKKITLEKIYNSLVTEKPEILMEKDLMEKSRKPIKKMLDISRKMNLV